MTDAEFLRALEDGTFPKEALTHREHLRLAVLVEDPRAIIQRYVAQLGLSAKYNETLTLAWMRLVALHRAKTLDELLRHAPQLLDSSLPLRHWSRDLLFSERARAEWVEPDLAPLPQP
jgi:hypothetical protein